MRVLLLNQTFFPDVAATAQYLTDLALGLVRRGHEVTVITSRRGYDCPADRFPPTEDWKGITIHRVAACGFGKSSRWRRAIDFASFIASCALQLLRVRRHEAVVALTSPPLIAFLAAWYCRFRGARLFYWVMDLNPDAAIAAEWIQPGSWVARILEAMSRFSFRHSHRIIVLDRFMRDRVIAKGVPAERIEVIPPWAQEDVGGWDPEGRQRFRSKHGLEKQFVVMHSGNHSPCHPLDTLMEAARRLADNPRYAFCFVGGGSQHGVIRQFAQTHQLRHVHVLPYSPLEELSGSLSAADLHAVVMGEPFVGMIHPCKVYNVLLVGAPILYLGPAKSHIGDLFADVRDTAHLHQVDHGDVDRMVQTILRADQEGTRGTAERYREAVERLGAGTLLERTLDLIEAETDPSRARSKAPSPTVPTTNESGAKAVTL